MIKTLYKFEIKRIEILKENGSADNKLAPKFSKKQIHELYYYMTLSRAFDNKALNLQRTGRLGTYASLLGQEATNVGSAYALREQDWLFPSFRMHGGMITKGVPIRNQYMFWGGDERGMQYDKKIRVFPVCITVAEQALHAAGYAWGLKLQGKKEVTLTDFGDGATSEGDFHEALNFAGTLKLPVIFLCQNNQYAISTPRKSQTASETIAQKAISYGIKGIQVDGNDVFAVYKATTDAIKDALKGIPTLIEAETYRLSDHTTSDDSKKYRPKKELNIWIKKDPITRLRKYMEKKKIWNKKQEEELQKKVAAEIEKAVKEYESIPKADEGDIFKYLFAEAE
ncbi:MAG: pyruvate dehydrogenase (acetyl-transferring) E1 component subunit alpha [Nanoarchaeota archaeon]